MLDFFSKFLKSFLVREGRRLIDIDQNDVDVVAKALGIYARHLNRKILSNDRLVKENKAEPTSVEDRVEWMTAKNLFIEFLGLASKRFKNSLSENDFRRMGVFRSERGIFKKSEQIEEGLAKILKFPDKKD